MQELVLKPTHKLVKSYYETLGQYGQLSIDHEMAVRSAFQALLRGCGKQFDWALIPEYTIRQPKAHIIKVDGALVDPFHLARGFWEAKDEHDDLEKEIRSKFDRGYPKSNIIFQAPEKAILCQNGIRQGLNEDIRDGGNLVELLKVFFGYREPHHEEWDEAVAAFKERIPAIAQGVKDKIEAQRRTNPEFVQHFEAFYDVCRRSINPNLSVEAVETMLIQHLMTERIFRRIFDNPDFTRRNVIAVEIEKVIDSMTAKTGNRNEFLKGLDHFYRAIELAAESTQDYTEKQQFMNSVYERFFQGFSPKEADTHGIVYTPQPIVDFMVRSVEDILKKEFGRSLSDKGVYILDPFVGTGNFITRVMKEIKTTALPYKYENELHCNEVMLLPYYVASMNIEHEYLERTGEYQPFPGICLVDTFELAEPEQSTLSFMSEENTARVKRQKDAPIFVIIGNPPYNAGQLDENDNNKNRKYPTIDKKISVTYASGSRAKLLSSLRDPYVRAFRWAADRIGTSGVVAYVSNNSFVDQIAFDGVRRELGNDFDAIYVLNLGGNVRKNPKLSGTTHNVFGIQVGVCISFFVRIGERAGKKPGIFYSSLDEWWTKEQRYAALEGARTVYGCASESINPDSHHTWLIEGLDPQFETFIKMGDRGDNVESAIFSSANHGVYTGRDSMAYAFGRPDLETQARAFIEAYDSEVERWRRSQQPSKLDDFVDYSKLKWSRNLKRHLLSGDMLQFQPEAIVPAVYRPFVKNWLYLSGVVVDEPGPAQHIFNPKHSSPNVAIWVKTGSEWPMFALTVTTPPDYLPQGGSRYFSYYRTSKHDRGLTENITDWALNEFRTHYSDPNITKWDIFHYVYAVLHHPEYRERYAANLKRELPRIPFVGSPTTLSATPLKDCHPSAALATGGSALPGTTTKLDGEGPPDGQNGGSPGLQAGDKNGAEAPKQIFRAFADAGKRLADLHVNYEQQPEYPLERVEKGQLNWRVEKMRLSKDKTTLAYNEFLTLKGIPPETYEYRLGNRSALEWVIDQYQVSTDKRSGITNDPNRADDPEYILRLTGQVITVSLETTKIVNALPALEDSAPAKQ